MCCLCFSSTAALVSRQFVDMSRSRIEGLLAAFPKLVGTGKQHTYVETENVRYVYQPIEALYLLVITNKQSNILEDLETLRLLSKLVSCSQFLCYIPTIKGSLYRSKVVLSTSQNGFIFAISVLLFFVTGIGCLFSFYKIKERTLCTSINTLLLLEPRLTHESLC